MAEIIPAILAKSYEELEEKLDIVAGHTKSVQIDICDGQYVQNRTWPYLKGTLSGSDQIFDDIISQEKALPHWEEIDFEFDLMVKDPYVKIPDFVSAGATRVIVHKGSVSDEELRSIIKDFGKDTDLSFFKVELGIALMPGDSPEAIKAIADKTDFVQIMGIDRIGFQGQSFDSRALELVKALKKAYPDLPCAVDGHVDLDTAKELIKAGTDRLVVGSALFESPDFLGTLKEFQALS